MADNLDRGGMMIRVPAVANAPETERFRLPLPYLIALLGIAAASVLIRVPFLQVPMINDEGGYAYVAHFMSEDYQLYRDIPFDRPQAIFYLYQVIFVTLGDSVQAIRLFAALLNATTLLGVFFLAQTVSSCRNAMVSAILFGLFSAGPSMEGFTANAEIFAQLPIVLSAFLVWKEKWAWAGLLAAAAVLLKPSGLSALMLAVAWAFVNGAALRGTIRVTFAFLLGLLPSVIHGAWIGWGYYWDSMFQHRTMYATQDSLRLATQFRRLASGALLTLPSWGIPAALAGLAVFRKIERPQLFGILWLGSSCVGMAMGGFWFPHYFIQLLAPLVLLAGMVVPLRARGRWMLLPAILLVLAGAVFSRDVILWSSSPSQISWQLYGRSGYLAAADAAEYVAANTKSTDSIFVAFGQAEIYFLARRRTAFPYMYYANFSYSQQIYDGAMDSIRQGVPAMVVVAQQPPADRMTWDQFMVLLSGHYERVHVVTPASTDGPPIVIFGKRQES